MVNRAHWPTKENRQNLCFFSDFFRPTQKITREGPKWGREVLFPANPDLPDILGRTDLDFENFYFFYFLGSQISGLGPAWAHPLGPSLGPPTWARLGHTHLGPAWAHPHGPGLGPTHMGPAWAHPLGPGMGPPTWAQLGPTLGWAPRVGSGGPLGWALG